MSQNLPNMLQETISKIREMVDVNNVIGDPITTADGVTIIPVSKVSVGFGGGGSDYVSRNVNKQENPFGGGAGGGVKVTPIAFFMRRHKRRLRKIEQARLEAEAEKELSYEEREKAARELVLELADSVSRKY